MKQDILEQIVEDHLALTGHFTAHNIYFHPAETDDGYVTKEHCVPSDIDVVGIRPNAGGAHSVVAVSCKSWQSGFDPIAKLNGMHRDEASPPEKRRPMWKYFRELWKPIWANAFRREIMARAHCTTFTYRLAVTAFTGPIRKGCKDEKEICEKAAALWAADPTIAANLAGNRLEFITVSQMFEEMAPKKTTPAPSQLGRLLQVLKAAGALKPETSVARVAERVAAAAEAESDAADEG